MKTRTSQRWAATAAAVVAVSLTTVACSGDSGKKDARRATKNAARDAVQSEQAALATSFSRLANTQQVPSFDYSQERQTLIDVQRMRAEGATSTTAGYLEGVGLVWWCPSAGAPVPSTYQLSSSQQYVDLPDDDDRHRFPLDQGEPTGVYVGESSGTWTLCLDDNGKKFAKYWEGYVDSTVGVISTYPGDKRVRLQQATFTFTEKPR